MIQAVLHPGDESDPDPQPRHHRRVRCRDRPNDLGAANDTLPSRYDSRWTIETRNQEAKAHGVGQAPNHVHKTVERTVPFGFPAQTITICCYQPHNDPDTDLNTRRRQPPRYQQKTTVSYSDMLAALRRELIRHEF